MAVVGTADAIDLQSWDQKIDKVHKRFKVLTAFNNDAVLDMETQLVWERIPDNMPEENWNSARSECLGKDLGERRGWRLPSIHELLSLGPLTPGHPFEDVQEDDYWSATTVADHIDFAWIATFGDGQWDWDTTQKENTTVYMWCVRGGSPGPDQY